MNQSPADTEEYGHKCFPKHNFDLVKRFGLLLGLVTGAVLQCSSTGMNFFIITMWSKNRRDKLEIDVFILSTLMSLLVTFIMAGIVHLARFFITTSFKCAERQLGSQDKASSKLTAQRKRAVDLTMYFESRFVSGALIGIGIGFTLTDLFLGVERQTLFKLALLVMTIAACNFVLLRFDNRMEAEHNQPRFPQEYTRIRL